MTVLWKQKREVHKSGCYLSANGQRDTFIISGPLNNSKTHPSLNESSSAQPALKRDSAYSGQEPLTYMGRNHLTDMITMAFSTGFI